MAAKLAPSSFDAYFGTTRSPFNRGSAMVTHSLTRGRFTAGDPAEG